MDLVTKLKMQEWTKDYADWKSSGMTKKKWCQERGMRLTTFDYHNRRIRDEAAKLMKEENSVTPIRFARVPDSAMKNNPVAVSKDESDPDMVINLRNSSIRVSNGVSETKLKMVLEVLINAE